MKTTLKYFSILILLSAITFSSCNKIIDIPPSKNQIENGTVFRDSTTAVAALLGAYHTLGTVHTAIKSVSLYSDEYSTTSGSAVNLEYAASQLLPSNTTNSALWGNLYSVIFQCNSVLEGTQASMLSVAAKKQIDAEARFIRAFSYFYLVNFYDNIPLILTTEVNVNKIATQSTAEEIYSQMIKDLIDARSSLGKVYQGSGRVRANRYAADALLARIYLYQKNYQAAIDLSSEVIADNTYNLSSVKPEDVFLSSSPEAILQLWMNNGFLTDAAQVIPATSTAIPTYTVHSSLNGAFENSDQRKTKWIGLNTVTAGSQAGTYFYPAKYKARAVGSSRPEFIMALRLAEQYLIRAEAQAQLGNTPAAVADLNLIRLRSGLSSLDQAINQTDCLEAVAKERRIELFGEWGHRLLDLKRNAKLDQVVGGLKPTWNPQVSKAFPIPTSEIIYNPKLKQNYGYPN